MNVEDQDTTFRAGTSIFYKLMLLVTLLVLVTVGTSTYFAVKAESRILSTGLVQMATQMVQGISSNAKSAFRSLDWIHVEKQLQESAKNTSIDVIYAKLVKPNGETCLANDHKYYGEKIDPALMSGQGTLLNDHFFPETGERGFLLVHPTKIGDEEWYVLMGISLKSLAIATRNLIARNVSLFGVIVLLGLTGSFFLFRTISRPVCALAESAQIISNGDFTHKAAMTSRDEVGFLAHSFNEMVTRLNVARHEESVRKREVEEKNAQLEQEIVERRLVENELKQYRDHLEERDAKYETRKSYEKLEKTMRDTILMIGAIAEIRDPYMSGHQRRVSKLAIAIAKEMGLSNDLVEAIFMAASVHDIGKLSVPADILSKPGKISPLEYEMIKEHPRVGWNILRNADFPWPLEEIVYQHHERLNGSGYPRGLAGEKILMEAKIISVAEVVEAMSSHRPYRPALSIEKALEEIINNSGILYEPDVVAACVKLFTETGYKFE